MTQPFCHLSEGIECLESSAMVDYIGNEAFQVLVSRHGPFPHDVMLELGPAHGSASDMATKKDGQLATELDACRMWNEEVLDETESGQGLSDPCLAQAVGRPRRRMDGQLASGGRITLDAISCHVTTTDWHTRFQYGLRTTHSILGETVMITTMRLLRRKTHALL